MELYGVVFVIFITNHIININDLIRMIIITTFCHSINRYKGDLLRNTGVDIYVNMVMLSVYIVIMWDLARLIMRGLHQPQ